MTRDYTTFLLHEFDFVPRKSKNGYFANKLKKCIRKYCSKCVMPSRRTQLWDTAVLSTIHATKFDAIQIEIN